MLQRFMTRFSAGFVIAFHDIAPERAAAFIDALAPARPIPLDEIVERTRKRRATAGLFAITIDDGAAETVRSLSELFLRRQWPATFYLPTEYLDSRQGMWWQWWRAIKPLLPARRIELKSGSVDLSRAGAAGELERSLERRWHSERIESYRPFMQELIDYVKQESRKTIETPAPITWTEVTELAKTGLIQFESHGVSHAAMSSLGDEELDHEMRHSREVVSDHTGRACRHIAYPFGSSMSIGPRAAAAASRYYSSATTMVLGHVDGANLTLLPRIPLYPENSTRVARLKVLLKCTSLHKAAGA